MLIKGTLKKVKRQIVNKGKISAIHSTDKGIVSNIHRELL